MTRLNHKLSNEFRLVIISIDRDNNLPYWHIIDYEIYYFY